MTATNYAELVDMARAAQHDERLSDGALYGKLADAILALQREVDQWKKVYDLRGKALARPCLNCGHVQAVIRPADAAIGEGGEGE